MVTIFKKCKFCGNDLKINYNSQIIVCDNCLNQISLNELLTDEEKTFLQNAENQNLENELKYNSFILRANEKLNDSQFSSAEKLYKQAIDINENRYEAYLGVAKAKSENFSNLNNIDCLEYLKLALEKADIDEKYAISAIIAKFNIK